MAVKRKKVRHTITFENDVEQLINDRVGRGLFKDRSAAVNQIIRKVSKIDPTEQAMREIAGMLNRNFHSAKRDAKNLAAAQRHALWDLRVTQEILASLFQAFYNHTPPLQGAESDMARKSGRARFRKALEMIASNLSKDQSLLDGADFEAPEPTIDQEQEIEGGGV